MTLHDDITWCTQDTCPLINCMRNQKNMEDPSDFHSYAAFDKTDECPIYRMEQLASAERGEKQP